MNLIKLHLKYLITKTNLILFSILLLSNMIMLTLSSGAIYSFSERWFMMTSFKESYIDFTKNIFKIILPLISSFLFGNSFLDYNDNYLLIFHNNKKTRIKFYFTKLISIILVIFLINFTTFIIYSFIGYLSIPCFVMNDLNFNFWYRLFLLCIIYGVLSLVVVLSTNHSFGYIIVIIIYIAINALNEINGKILNLVGFFFPCYLVKISSVYLIFIVVFYNIISFWIYYYKDR